MNRKSIVSTILPGAGLILALCLSGIPAAQADWALVIAGTPRNYDTPAPLGYGTNNVVTNSWVTNSVDSAVTVAGINWGCNGWALKKTTGGTAVSAGTGTEAVFQMTTNLTLTWNWTNYILTVAGSPVAVGTPAPLGFGANSNLAANTWITNSVDGAVSTNGTNWGSKGWALKRTTGGAAVANGSGTQAVFQMTTNLTLTWNWTNYWLAIDGNPGNFGVPAPLGYGTVSNIQESTWVTNAVATPADESAGTRRACIGWDLRYANGTPITNDATAQAVFQMRADSLVLTWNWTNEYYLAVTANSNGAVDTTPVGWYTNGLQATAQATPDPGSVFIQWTGDVPAESRTNNPVTLVLDQKRTIQAQFAANATPELKQWTGTGNWTSWTNWSPAGMPGPEDDVLIKSGSVTLSDPVNVASFAITNATLTFVNWMTRLTAQSNVTIRKTGVMTCLGGFLNEGMSNRVAIVCSNLAINGGGSINVTGCGYKGGFSNTEASQGPGASGSYGGKSAGPTYGTPETADNPGSGGSGRFAGNQFAGGNGGGAVWVQASGVVRVDGVITANGISTANGSGGSGGGIHVECKTFEGTGTVTAIGGAGVSFSWGGGGGRVAVLFDPTAQAAAPKPGVAFSLRGSTGPYGNGDIGTLYFPTMDLVNPAWMPHSGQLIVGTWADWTGAVFSVQNGWLRLPAAGSRFQITNTWSVAGASARLELNAPQVNCGNLAMDAGRVECYAGTASGPMLAITNNALLTNGAQLLLYASVTNDAIPGYGALLGVSNTFTIATNSWLYPYSNPTNGGSPLIRVSKLEVAAGGGIDADGKGYSGGTVRGAGNGPGRGINTYSGAGYGGVGGRNGGQAYGDSNAPVECGSGAYLYSAYGSLSTGRGGGLIRIEADRQVSLDGELTANGNSGAATGGDGGGSGGGIYVTTRRFAGTTGLLTANGGNGSTDATRPGGAGGGGRIAVYSMIHTYSGTASVTNGTGYAPSAGVGTIVWGHLPGQGTIMLIR